MSGMEVVLLSYIKGFKIQNVSWHEQCVTFAQGTGSSQTRIYLGVLVLT